MKIENLTKKGKACLACVLEHKTSALFQCVLFSSIVPLPHHLPIPPHPILNFLGWRQRSAGEERRGRKASTGRFYTVVTLHWRKLLLYGLPKREAFLKRFRFRDFGMLLGFTVKRKTACVLWTERKRPQVSSCDIPGLKLTNKWSRPNILIAKQDTFYVRFMCTKMFLKRYTVDFKAGLLRAEQNNLTLTQQNISGFKETIAFL